MSSEQIKGNIITVENMMFGRCWKVYSFNKKIKNNCLPSISNIQRTERYAETQILHSIIESIMASNSSCVIYSNDGSSQNRIGRFVVQFFIVNGVQRALPTLSVCNEAKDTFKELMIVTIRMLSAASWNKYSVNKIFSKIDIVMSNSTSHNLGVAKLVAEELNV